MAKLRTNIAKAIGPRSAKRSVNLTFDLAGVSKELDPYANMVYNRAAEMRRAMAKHEGKKGLVTLIIKRHLAWKEATQVQQNSKKDLGIHQWRDAAEDEEVPPLPEGVFGPITLFLKDLENIGSVMGSDFIIRTPNEPDIDMWNTPWQHLKTQIMQLVTRKRICDTMEERTFVHGIKELDSDIINKLLSNMGSKEANIYRYIATGAMWNEEQLHNIDQSKGICRNCGEKVTDSTHVLWHCPVINKYRKNKDLCNINPNELPIPLKYGLPCTMECDLVSTYTGHTSLDQNSQELMGAPCNKRRRTFEAKEALLQDTLQAKGLQKQGLNARQAFRMLMQDTSPTAMPMPLRCTVDSPEEPNVYSDGSWLHPGKSFLSFGGAGVWWPNRTIRHDAHLKQLPLSDAENMLSYYEQKSNGFALYTSIGGFAGSSTRTELAAAIIAMSAHGPIHLASDSNAFVKRALKMLSNLRKGIDKPRKWKLVSDGDLWEHFYLALKAKGPNAFNVTWVKGHATEEHIKNNVTTQTHKEGNDKADEIADLGANIYGKDIHSLANIFHIRHDKYYTLMKKAVTHIVEAYLINKELNDRRENAEKTKAPKVKPKQQYVPLTYPELHLTSTVDTLGTLTHYGKLGQNREQLRDVEKFISWLQISEQGKVQRSITWIELYIIFRIRGYGKPIKDPIKPGLKKATLDKQLRAFKANMRNVLSKITNHKGTVNHFKPAKAKDDSLIGVGITGKQTAIACNIYVTSKEQLAIANALATLNRAISNKQLSEFMCNKRGIAPHPLKLNGKVGWDSTLPILNNERSLDCRFDDNCLSCHAPVDQVSFYKCPRSSCSKVEPSSVKIFQYSDLDRPHVCPFCKKATKVRSWQCTCEIPWHLCATHRYSHSGSANESRGPQNKPKEPNTSNFSRATYVKRKRLVGEVNDEQREVRQDSAHKCAKVCTTAKRKSEIELSQLESESKTARIYEKLLSRFKGKLGGSSRPV